MFEVGNVVSIIYDKPGHESPRCVYITSVDETHIVAYDLFSGGYRRFLKKHITKPVLCTDAKIIDCSSFKESTTEAMYNDISSEYDYVSRIYNKELIVCVDSPKRTSDITVDLDGGCGLVCNRYSDNAFVQICQGPQGPEFDLFIYRAWKGQTHQTFLKNEISKMFYAFADAVKDLEDGE